MKLSAATRPYSQSVRAQSAEATGRRIVEAFLARLMEQWYDEVTLDRVAEDAEVTVQTVIRRFGGKEGLLEKSVEVLASQINARRAAPTGDIDRSIDNLIKDYEEIGDMVIRLLALEPRHPALKKCLDFGRASHSQWVSSAFAGPLGRLPAGLRESAVDALVIATDAYSWKILRRDRARSVSATKATMKRMVLAALAEFSNPQPTNNQP